MDYILSSHPGELGCSQVGEWNQYGVVASRPIRQLDEHSGLQKCQTCHRIFVLRDRTLCICGEELSGEEYRGIGDNGDSGENLDSSGDNDDGPIIRNHKQLAEDCRSLELTRTAVSDWSQFPRYDVWRRSMTDACHKKWADDWCISFSEIVINQMNDRLSKTGMYIKFDAGELLDPAKYSRFKGTANKHVV